MQLTPGSRLGPYEISAQIGVGGMGEVYRGRDTTLARQVAIKVLPPAFASDPERLARFDREAKTLAALNHPHIAQVYGFEQVDGVRALVMELVDGETLAERIARGPIPSEEAIVIARQIAEALEAAHEQGIIHRDLKPANVKLRPDGVVKVLDFGLAKALGGDSTESNAALADSPTVMLGATTVGVILGTAPYMSPEQASGHAVDRRTDVWAFGAVLYEMLSGQKAFPGESVTDTLATVLKVDPDWRALPGSTPASIRQLIQRCLTRDRRKRLQAIGEARLVLEAPDQSVAVATTSHPARTALWATAAAAVFGLALAALSLVHFREQPAAPDGVLRFELALPRDANPAIVSPDGSQLLLVGPAQGRPSVALAVRRLDSLETRQLPVTAGVAGLPFWSYDGRYVAFSSEGKLKTLDLMSGAVQIICDARISYGGFWASNNTIVFSNAGSLMQVSASGGTPTVLIRGSESDFVPVPLPDGRQFFFTRISGDGAVVGTYLGSGDGGAKPRKLMDGIVSSFVVSRTNPNVGYVVFLREPIIEPNGPPIGTLMAQRFDIRNLQLAGDPVRLVDRAAFSSASPTILTFGRPVGESGDQLTIFDTQGKERQKLGEPGEYSRVSFSPDGSRVVATRRSGRGNTQLWTFELARGIWTPFPMAPDSNASFPVWSPDGARIAFASRRNGQMNLYQRLSNGGGEEELLFKGDESLLPLSWSRDGQFLGVGAGSAETQTHFVLRLDAKGQPVGKLTTFVRRGWGLGIELSPERTGPPRWVAYQATRNQRTEIYLLPFDPNSPTLTPADAGEWQVSKGGGSSPRWHPNGKQLLYLAPDRTLMAADLTGDPKAPTALARTLFKPTGIERTSQAGVATFSWSISPDGEQFLIPIPVAAGVATPPLTVIVNWTSLVP